jgi:hypothetical protein
MDAAAELRVLCATARRLADAEPDLEVQDGMWRSVVRPLSVVAADGGAPADASLQELALRATRLRSEPGVPLELSRR